MRPQTLPEAEIRFAAKAGFLSKKIWNDFFAVGSERWRRRQWQLFQERDLFRPHPSALARDVLVLHRKQHEVKFLVGEAISSPTYAPQIGHDEIAARIALTLSRAGLILTYRFESEMKREEWYEKKLYQGIEKFKYPDVIFEILEAEKVSKIALEVELSRKNPIRYRQILEVYATRRDLKYVLFVARTRSIFDNLKIAMRETYYPDSERPIGFCELDSWIKDPVRAPIYFSERITTLEELTTSGIQN